jgi:hypothetical protein
MLNGRKRWGGAAIMVVVLGATGLVLRRRHHEPRALGEATTASNGGNPWRDFPAGTPVAEPPSHDAGPAKPDWFSARVTPDQVDSAMKAWREAIIEKRQDAVLTLDQAFTLLPGVYGPALLTSARSDSEERVRAFSTRVLGKLQNPELVADFQGLLADKSPYVRQNAAWALGELGKRPRGRDMAQAALDDLRQAAGEDAATAVRAAATNALKALQ